MLLTYKQSSINIWIFPKKLLTHINGWIIMVLDTEEYFILVKEHILCKLTSYKDNHLLLAFTGGSKSIKKSNCTQSACCWKLCWFDYRNNDQVTGFKFILQVVYGVINNNAQQIIKLTKQSSQFFIFHVTVMSTFS